MKQRSRVLTLAFVLAAACAPVLHAQNVNIQPTGTITTNGATVPYLVGAAFTNTVAGGFGTVAIQVTGTFTGTLQFEGAVNCVDYGAPTGWSPTLTTTTGTWQFSAAGLQCVRVRASSVITGTAVIYIRGGGGGGVGGGGGSGSAPSGTIGAAVPATATPVAARDSSGNLAYFKFDGSGNLLTAVTGAGSGGTSAVDGAAYVAGTTAGTPTMGALDDAATTACAEDKTCIARLTAQRGIHVNLRTVAGAETGIAALPLQVSLANTGSNSNALAVSASSLPLPTGAAQDSTLTGRLPAGASPADAESNTNTSLSRIGGFNFVYNGTTWDRLRGDTTSGAWVNVKNTATVAGGKTNNNAAPGATNVGVLPGIANAAAPTYVEGDQVLNSIDLHGSTRNTPLDTTGVTTSDSTAHAQKTLSVDSTGTAIPVSDGGAGGTSANTTRTVTASDSPDVATLGATTDSAATAGSTGSLSAKLRLMTTQLDAIQTAVQLIDDDQTGATATGVVSAASTNSTNVKATAGRLMGMYLTNNTTTIYYMRFYNTATNPPTCSSATNYVFTMAIPPAPAAGQAGGFSMPFGPTGLAFSSGIGYCITGGPTSTDNTNAAVGIYGVLATK